MLYFYFFMLRPFLLELTRCRRRIAYLLSTVSSNDHSALAASFIKE
jgi:hypothetical protein